MSLLVCSSNCIGCGVLPWRFDRAMRGSKGNAGATLGGCTYFGAFEDGPAARLDFAVSRSVWAALLRCRPDCVTPLRIAGALRLSAGACCSLPNFFGGLMTAGVPKSSSEGTSNISKLSLFARVVREVDPPAFLFGSPSGTVVCLRGRSGDGASLLAKGSGLGTRREALPYVTTFFLRSGPVKLEDMKAAISYGGGGVIATSRKSLRSAWCRWKTVAR